MELVSATTSVVISKPAPAVKQSWYIKALYEIFRMKTNSYHEAFILNIMLFVPMGYLIPALLHRHAGEKGSAVHRWLWTVLICSAVSITIEILQQLTGFGMFDWNDWIANTVGSLLGVLVLYAYQRVHA
jgi:glycopeptide antibiotics resistance protein